MVKVRMKELDLSAFDDAEEALDALAEGLPKEARSKLKEILDIVHGEASETRHANSMEAQVELLEFMAMPIPTVGQLVERNEFGKTTYRYPDEGKGESAIVVDVWPQYRGRNGEVANGVIAITGGKRLVKTFAVDLRYYQPVTASANDKKLN